MHYYKRNIGDYHKKAGRLSMLEHGAYTLLIDSCYDREQFPTLEEAIDWCWARSDEEINAVKFVLSRFFSEDENGVFVQNRINDELSEYQTKRKTNARVAREREEKRRTKRGKGKDIPNEASTVRAEEDTDRAREYHESPPNQEPLTTNHKPITNNKNTPSTSGDAESGCDSTSLPDDSGKKTKTRNLNYSPKHHVLAVRMSNPVKQRFPGQDIDLEVWADAIRKLIEIDKHEPEHIMRLWGWIQSHEQPGFSWADNIRTPMKLRQKDPQGLKYFDKTLAQWRQEHATGSQSGFKPRKQTPSERILEQSQLAISAIEREANQTYDGPVGEDDAVIPGEVGEPGGGDLPA